MRFMPIKNIWVDELYAAEFFVKSKMDMRPTTISMKSRQRSKPEVVLT